VYVDKEILNQQCNLKVACLEKKKKFRKTKWIFGQSVLHYPNEAARHKLLDVAGDLAPYRN
jgi:UDP-3-O-[3-hydroxymyristoyl] N-acetylglucosamine deacetylase/3-hydroxyacyl-[acyl-carrier-protein] dehydratase